MLCLRGGSSRHQFGRWTWRPPLPPLQFSLLRCCCSSLTCLLITGSVGLACLISHMPSSPLARLVSAAAAARLLVPSLEKRALSSMAGSQEKAPSAGGVSERIMPHLLNIYGSRAMARDFEEIYAPNATFEDPLMRAHGVKQIESAFYTLPKVFGESKIVEYTVHENPTGPGKTEVLIDNKQHYKVFGKAVDLTSLIRLQVEDGKVVKHEDWWDKKPLKNRDTVAFPLAGRLAEATRRGAMLLTHALMGFGKDPTPSSSSSSSPSSY